MTDKPEQPEDQQANAKPGAEPSDDSAKGEASAAKPEAAAESGDAEKAKHEKADSSPQTPPAKKRSGSKKSANWSAFFLVLLLLASIGGLAYYQWLHQQNFKEIAGQLDEQLERQSSQVNKLSQSLDKVEQDAERALQTASQAAEERQQQTRQLEQQLEQQTRQLQQQVRALREQVQAISTTTTEDWKLAEAYYLTRLAGQRLLMERDTGSALALLQAADKIVRNYPDPDLYPVREALADDIAALKLTDDVDREGLYLQISALSKQISELPVAEPSNFEPRGRDSQSRESQAETDTVSEQAPAEDEGSGVWESIKQSFARAWAKLQDFVRVTEHDEPFQPLIAPDQQLYLRSSLQTALDTAQLALLREQPSVYESSLEKAETLLTQLYAESEQRREIREEVQSLKEADIVQELPDISESQEALGNYLQQRHRLAPQDGNQQAEQEAQQ